ncbi:helix-turn-helix transcriptional regulator [Brevibacillus reuszeri]|uniref:helix-turn-helix transcriptional regulator n=1 Tax=Brevibacillus reuszeri TaxID=54915 RepID=UPI003D25483B
MEGNPFKRFLARNVLFTHEVAEKLNVSRQRISILHKEGELVPIKSTANGSVYLLQDVLQFMEKKGVLSRYENPTPPKYACETSDTHENVAYAQQHIGQLNSIERVSIFFEHIDAAIENYFLPLEKYRYGDLISLSIPHMVIRDSKGNEMWLPGCNCGYGGTGPHGSEEVLQLIGVPKNLREQVFYHPVVKYVKNENGSWEVNVRESDFDFRSISSFDDLGTARANMYWHQGRLTLLQDKRYSKSEPQHVLEKYWAFIPHPIEYILLAEDEQAIDYGFFDPSSQYGYKNGAYRLIIRDYSGRQLWLDPYIEKNKSLEKQPELKDILEACGFDIGKESADQRLSRWLGLLLKKVEPSEPIVGRRSPF